MKIAIEAVPEMTLEEFADLHELLMEVRERSNPDLPRYYAHFKHTDVMENEFLVGVYGDGSTIEEAIAAYGPKISLMQIRVGIGSNARKIRVPRLVQQAERSTKPQTTAEPTKETNLAEQKEKEPTGGEVDGV